MGSKGEVGALTREEFVVTGGGDHRRVVGGERGGREEDLESLAPFGESLAKQGIARYASGDEDVVNARVFGGGERALHQILHHGMLKARDEVNRRLRTMAANFVKGGRSTVLRQARRSSASRASSVSAHAVEHGGLKSGKTEVQRIALHLDMAKIRPRGNRRSGRACQ